MSFNEIPATSRPNGAITGTRMEDRRDAIAVKNAFKNYGKGKNATQVLADLTLTVKEGTM